MAIATLIPPIAIGGVIGYRQHRFINPLANGKGGAVFGALWAITAEIISHRSCQLQEGIDKKRVWLLRILAISSFALALISGVVLEQILTVKSGLSIPNKLIEKIGGAAILGSRALIPLFSSHRLW